MRGFEKESGSIPGQVVPDGGVRVGNLSALLARAEAAEGPDFELERDIATGLGLYAYEKRGRDQRAWFYPIGLEWHYRADRPPRFTTSLDAALSLCERVLPGWNCSAVKLIGEPCEGYVWEPGHAGNIQGNGANPALALIAALLKAKIAEAASPSEPTVTGPGMVP